MWLISLISSSQLSDGGSTASWPLHWPLVPAGGAGSRTGPEAPWVPGWTTVRAQGREESADPQEPAHAPALLTGGLWPAAEAACPGSHQKPLAGPRRTSRCPAEPHGGRGRGNSRCRSRPPRPVEGGLSPSSPLHSAPRSSFREGPAPGRNNPCSWDAQAPSPLCEAPSHWA